MQHQIERLQAQLGDLKGKSIDTQCASNTLDPLSQKLEDENVSLEFQDTTKGTSANSKFANQSTLGKPSLQPLKNHLVVRQPNAFRSERPRSSKTQVPPKVVETNDLNNLLKTSREDKFVHINQATASVRTNLITISQPHVITKKDVNSNSNGLSSTRVDITAKTKRPQPRSNPKNDKVPFASKSSCIKNKEVEVEDHHRNLLLSKNKKHMSSECNNIKLAIRNDKSEVVCAMCKQCLIAANHDVCVLNYVNDMISYADNQSVNVQMWTPTGRIFDFYGKLIESNDSECQYDSTKGDNACTSNPQEPTSKRFPNSTSFLGRNCSLWKLTFLLQLGVMAIYLEVTFRRNTCFVRNLEGIDLLKGNHITNFYTINLQEMASTSPIFLIARATSTKSWLWHQRLSRLNFDNINELVKNDLVTGLPKFKYHQEHLCPSCELMRFKIINGKRYALVIVDDYTHYTWVHFLRTKDEAPEEIKTFLKKIQVLLQAIVIIIRTYNGTEFKNQVLQAYFDILGISYQTSPVRTPHRNGSFVRKKTSLNGTARTI
ncbi:retrovirus-related pol polyprotein from transposon TNT 1-94 [Tanacetum coccineum]